MKTELPTISLFGIDGNTIITPYFNWVLFLTLPL
jgi:hypothetical protein